MMSPWASNTIPDPRPPWVSICTIEGRTEAISAWYSAWSWARAPVAVGAVLPGDAEAAGLGAVPPVAPEADGEGVAELACLISDGVARRTGEVQAASAASATSARSARRGARLRRSVVAICRAMLGEESWN